MAPPIPVEPDYGGACVSNIVPALVSGVLPAWMPAVVGQADAVVLLVADGLGWNSMAEHVAELPNLHSMTGSAATTVTPATTAAALTSITTGLSPGAHGITGFRMLVDEQVLNVLAWQTGTRHRPDPIDVQRKPSFLGRDVPAVTKSEYRGSGFTDAHLRGARFTGWSTTAVMIEQVCRLVGAGEKLVFAYYPGVDVVAHEFGLHDGFYARELVALDALVGSLIASLPRRATLLVTSDHGQVHLDPSDAWVETAELAPMIENQAGDARFRYLYARDGARHDLFAAAAEIMGDRGWALTRADLLARGWLGPDVGRPAKSRVGDVVLAPADPIGFVDPALPREARLRSAHGSLTADEMLVPLVAAPGTA